VKGTVHAAIGASAPVGLVATQHVTILQGAVMAAVSAGFSLMPDLDHPKACASQALGKPVHKAVHSLCRTVVKRTALGRDRSYIRYRQIRGQDPYHRTLTHTLLAALVMGAVTYGVTYVSTIGGAAVAALGVFMLWPMYRKTVSLVAVGAAAAAIGSVFLLDPWLMGLAVAGGYASHIVADGCTASGVPALWPLSIQGKRWWNIRLLGGMVASGSAEEKGPAIGVALASNALLILLSL
jgi:membrane-bound metal-dependent hydrolase YbcI (DUF457 family)